LIIVQAQRGVSALDLDSGALTQLYQPGGDSGNAWVSAAAASPDGQTLVLAYAPPPPPGQVQYGYSSLYTMPADGSAEPQVFLSPPEAKESLFTPLWSPDGHFIYYAHLDRFAMPNTLPQQYGFKYTLERIGYPAGGAPEVILENAFWPRLSADGARLVYVAYDPVDGSTKLMLAGPDGTDPREVPLPENFVTVDAPLFTPAGTALIVSAITSGPVPTPAASSWLEEFFAPRAAEAHNIPSDWWRVPLDGSLPARLTFTNDTGLFGAFSPDGTTMVYGSNAGLYLGQPDGSQFFAVPKIYGVSSVDWIQ
jgi:Tol biopolymer transport system component